MEMENREVQRASERSERGAGGPAIRVHWPICSATTRRPGAMHSKYIERTLRTLKHTPIFSSSCEGTMTFEKKNQLERTSELK